MHPALSRTPCIGACERANLTGFQAAAVADTQSSELRVRLTAIGVPDENLTNMLVDLMGLVERTDIELSIGIVKLRSVADILQSDGRSMCLDVNSTAPPHQTFLVWCAGDGGAEVIGSAIVSTLVAAGSTAFIFRKRDHKP